MLDSLALYFTVMGFAKGMLSLACIFGFLIVAIRYMFIHVRPFVDEYLKYKLEEKESELSVSSKRDGGGEVRLSKKDREAIAAMLHDKIMSKMEQAKVEEKKEGGS